MLPIDDFSLLELINEQYDYRSIEKGRTYQRQNRVELCGIVREENAYSIQAKVRGSRKQPYEVVIDLFPHKTWFEISGDCTCPMGIDCKHVVATLLALMETPRNLVAPSQPNGLSQRAVPAPKLDGPLKSWLDQLQKAAAPSVSAPAAERNERLIYLIKPELGKVRVECAVVRQLKAGGYGSPRNYSLSNVFNSYQPAQFVRPEDLLIASKIKAAQSGYGSYNNYIAGKTGAEILADMLATGRCHFQGSGKNIPALVLSPARSAKPVWVANEKGEQHPTFEIEPTASHMLPFVPPWYLDEATATCGPLKTEWTEAMASVWLTAPALPPEQATLLADELGQPQGGVSLPPPQKVEVEMVSDAQPVPCLRLYSAPVAKQYWTYSWGRNQKSSGDKEDVSFARLEFDYSGNRMPPEDSAVEIKQFRDGKLRRIHRDLKMERSFMQQLLTMGFGEAQSRMRDYQLDAHARAFVLETPEVWFEFVHRRISELRDNGWHIQVDESFRFRIATPESWYADAKDLGGNDWFGVELGVLLDGEKLNLLPILLHYFQSSPRTLNAETLAALPDDAAVPIPLPDGRTLGFPAKRLREMMGVLLELLDANSLTKRGQLKLNKLRAAELSGLSTGTDWRWLGNHELQELSNKLRNFSGIKPVAPSANLQASLRPYQQDGLSWLQFLREYGLAGILADDMGLGKTIQAIAHLQIEKESGRMDRPSIVIAPTSLMTNWRQEIERFASGLKALVLHGLDRKQHFEKIREHDVVITSYPLLPRDQVVLLEQEFHCVILDEAQFIKNPKTQYAQIACQLKARHHICLTGTPMENHLGELWSLFNFLLPGFLADEQRFNTIFRRPIEKGQNDDRRRLLARRVSPFILRRRKEEVVKELPPKTEIVHNVELAGPQRDLYESIRLAMHERVKAEVESKGINRAQIIILDALLKLRQVCCDPRLLSIASAQKVKQSAKLELLMDLIPEMIAEGRRILLFSQFTSMLDLIEEALAKQKIEYVLLTGQTNDRATPVQRFQNREVPLFLISLKAGGTGLNLTAADTVIHYDPWWNPAVENQATDRAHRIGQDKNVFVYKFLTVGTVEEKIAALQAKKRELVEGLLNEERRENLKLTQEDLDVLFAPIG